MEITFTLDLPKTIDLETVIRHETEYDDDGDSCGQRPVTVGEELIRRFVNTIEYEIRSELHRTVMQRVEKLADEKIQALMEEAVESGFQRTNTFGEPTGEPTSIRQLVLDRARDFLEKPRRRTTYAEATTELQELLEKQVDLRFKKELSAAIDEGKKLAIQAVREQAAEILAMTIGKMAEKGGA